MTTEALTPDEIDDLARRAQDGDRDALESLLAAIRPRALNVCRGVLPHLSDAEDACQEALLNISNKIGSWGGRGRFTTWMHVVAVNSARSTYRRMKNQAVAADPQEHGPLADKPDPRTTSVIAGTRLDLLEAMETIEKDHPQFVEPLLLRDVYGLSYEEIAQQIGIPLGTVKAQIHHGRKLAQTPAPRVRVTRSGAGLLAIAALLLAGCTSSSDEPEPSPAPAVSPSRTGHPAHGRPRRGPGLPRRRRPRRRRAQLPPRPGLGTREPAAHGDGDAADAVHDDGPQFQLDLGAGLKVAAITVDGVDVPFDHDGKDLVVHQQVREDHRYTVRIRYSGTPAAGAGPHPPQRHLVRRLDGREVR